MWTGALAVGQTVVITYSVQVRNPDPGDKVMINRVVSDALGSNCPSTVSAATADPVCTTQTSVVVPALAVTVTADRTSTTPGGVVGYTVTVQNVGETPYLAATVTSSLTDVLDDASYDGNATATGGSVSLAGDALVWVGDLPIGAEVSFTYSVTVNSPDLGDRSLVTAVSSADAGSTCTAGIPCTNVVAVLVPGLSVSTYADAATATPGDLVTFTITVTNTGETSYVGATISAPLDNVLDDATFSGVATATAGIVTYTAPNLDWTGSLSPGESAIISYSVVVDPPGAGNRSMTSTVVAPDPGSTCQAGSLTAACTATVVILVPGLSIAQTADTATTTPGSVVGYTIQINNDGETPYTAVTMTDALSGVLTDSVYNNDAAVTVGGGTLNYAAPVLTWTGDLAVGATATVTFSITVNNPDNGDKEMVNSVSSDAPGSSCPSGSSAPGCVTIVRVLVPGLLIATVADRSTVIAGSPVQYTITLTNNGETDYAPATLTSSLLDVLDDASYSGDATTTVGTVGVVNNTLTWSGSLAVGATATITYSVTTYYPPPGNRSLTNTVVSTSPGSTCTGDAAPGCSVSVGLLNPALTITKIVDTPEIVAGGIVRYTISATNTGEADYAEAVLSDSLAGLLDDAVYNGDASAGTGVVTDDDGTVDWSGPLPMGDTVVITFSVTVNATVTGDELLANEVLSASVGSSCPTPGANPACATSTTVFAQTLTLTGLTPGFSLTGQPGSIVEGEGILVMTVTTNSQSGYVVTVQPQDDVLAPLTPGNPDSIPVGQLGVRESGNSPFQFFTPDTPVVVHQQNRPSAPGGDAVSNDYQVQIPFVSSDTYSGTLEYIASTQ